MFNLNFIPVIVTISISLCLLIDTSGWWIRAFSDGTNMGKFVSKTNLYTYSGRLFSFIYMSLLALYIESGATTRLVCAAIVASLLVGAVAHLLLLNRSHLSQKLLRGVGRLLKLEIGPELSAFQPLPYGVKLRWTAAAATTIFCLGMSAPYILASMFPDYRLTLASTGQILNAMGMMFILFFVDYLMYSAWDASELPSAVFYYSSGRLIGILGAALIVFMLYVTS
jgi:hypothetical protein